MVRARSLIPLLIVLCPASLFARGASTPVRGVEVINGVALFATDRSLCRTDGTPAGTHCFPLDLLLSDRPVLLNGTLYAFAGSPAALYAFDGESAPRKTMQIEADGYLSALTTNGKQLFYFVSLNKSIRLMSSDGTAAGMSVVAEFPTPYVETVRRAGDSILFSVRSPTFELEWWRSDGTPGGTFPLLPPNVTLLTAIGEVVLFQDGKQLWRTDGTPAGTFLVADVTPGAITVNGGFAYFTFARQVWRTDGTTAVPLRRVDFDPAVTSVAGGRLFFVEQQEHATAIWGANESYGNPTMLARIAGHPYDSPIIGHAGPLAFFSLVVNSRMELWRSDGTPAGTFSVARLANRYSVRTFTLTTEKVLFVADDGVHGNEPWVSDGSTTGTFMLANLTREGAIRGRVTDSETGRPLEGAVVSITNFNANEPAVRTDADGRYELPGLYGEYTIEARSDYHRPLLHVADVDEYEEVTLDFALRLGARVAGRVVDPGGKPIEGIHLRLFSDVGMPFYVRTYRDGRFETGPVWTQSTWSLEAEMQRGYNRALRTGIRLTPGVTNQVELTLQPFGRVVVRLVDAVTKGPLRARFQGYINAFVSRGLWDHEYFSGSYPAVEFALPDGDYQFRADLKHTDVYREDTPAAVHVTAGTTQTVDLPLQPRGASIRGVILDSESGARLSGILLYALRIGGLELAAAQSTGGSFETEPVLPDGRYRITTQSSSATPYLPSILETEVRFAEDPRPEVVFRLTRAGTISGRVVDAEGRSLRDVRVQVTSDRESRTDVRGSYVITGLPTGTYRVTAKLDGFNDGRAEAIAVTAGKKTKLDLRMTRQ